MKRITKWSAPHYGVTHLVEPEIQKPYQATVNSVGGIHVALLINRVGFVAFKERTLPTALEARRQCEQWVSERNLWM